MVTRFRLTSDTTAPSVSPTAQSYTHDQAVRRKLKLTDTSTLTTSAYNPDAADDLVAGDSLHIQFVSNPLNSGAVFTSGDTLKFCVQGTEPNADCNQGVSVFVSVVDSAGTTVQATLRTKAAGTTELPGVLTSRFKSTTLSGSYTLVAGDRIVVEMHVTGTPVAGEGVNGHNASIRWGSGGAGGDLLENDTQTGTTLDPWIEFATTVTEQAATVDLTGVSTIVLNSTGEADQIQKLQGVSTVVLNSTGQARQIHTLDAISTVVLNSVGEADQIQKLTGTSTVILNSTGTITVAAFANLFGNSTIVLNSTGQARQTHTLDGISTVVLNSVSDLDLIYQLQTNPTIVINSSLDLDLVRRLLATSTIVLNSALDLELIARLLSTGTIVLNSTGTLTVSAPVAVVTTRGYVTLVETLNGVVATTQTKIGTVTPSETLVGASSISES